MIGTIIEHHDARGYSLIQPEDRGQLVFLHISEIIPRHKGERPAIRVGDRVRFELGVPAKGTRTQAIECVLLADRLTDEW